MRIDKGCRVVATHPSPSAVPTTPTDSRPRFKRAGPSRESRLCRKQDVAHGFVSDGRPQRRRDEAWRAVHQSPGLCSRAFGAQPRARQRIRSRSMIEWSEGSSSSTPSRIAPSMLSLTADSNSMR